MQTISIGGVEYSVERAKLRMWLALEDRRSDINKAVETKHIGDIADAIIRYVSTALNLSADELQSVSWTEVVLAWKIVESENKVSTDFPVLLGNGRHDIMDVTWDYKGRGVYSVLHLLCQSYGWTLEYVSNLDVDDGIALMQEILVEQQLRREWEWSLSEIAYPYNSSTKTSKFQPLQRPAWMNGKPKPLKKVKILKSMLPVGVIDDVAKVGLHGTGVDSIKH